MMKIVERFTKTVFKWATLYPRVAKVLSWAYYDLVKMPQYHVGLRKDEAGSYVILLDDPGDVARVASNLENAVELAYHREYCTYSGQLGGTKVSVASTGIGGPSTAIAIEELAKIGVHTFIYLGDGQRFAADVTPGDLVVVTGAVREEGTGLHYHPLAYPAIADQHVADCLRKGCMKVGKTHQVGIVHSQDSYYGKIHQVGEGDLPGVCCSDLNAASVFLVSSAIGVRAGGLLVASDQKGPVTDDQITAAIEGLKSLIANDPFGR